MTEAELSTRIEAIAAAIENHQLAVAEDLAERTDQAIEAAVDPMLYGWLQLYRFKIAYQLQDWPRAWELRTPRFQMALNKPNTAWWFSVGAEVASHVSKPAEVVTLLGQCIQMRMADGDGLGALQAASTGIELLRVMHREDLNSPFLALAIDQARLHGDLELALRGVAALVGNVVATNNAVRLDSLFVHREWLTALDDDRARAIVQQLDTEPRFAARRTELAQSAQLWTAATAGDVPALTALRAGGIAIDLPHTHGRRALFGAALAGHVDAVTWLLDAGADLDARMTQGRTALHIAADQGHTTVVEQLIARGAALDLVDHREQTALHLAGWQDHLGAVRALLVAGADATRLDVTGTTALALAATEPVPGVIAAFLDAGVPVDQRSAAGRTPLMYAAQSGRGDIMALLVERGADATLKDPDGRTAADYQP